MTFGDNLRTRLARILPVPQLRAGATGSARHPVKRIILFGCHPNPTSDYYFAARLAAPNMPEFHVADIRHGDFSALDPHGAFVILCRYASAATLAWIERESTRLAGVGLFLDDDIPAVITGKDAPLRYRIKLFARALLPLGRLNRHLDIVWASTPRLAQRLSAAQARVLPPAPPEGLASGHQTSLPSKHDRLLIAYHATAVHVEEHRFLKPILCDVLASRPNAHFEVVAGRGTAHLWQGMERVTVRAPLSWPDYLAETSKRIIDIMLVPLSPSPVNDCRSPTKRIDVARTCAAGIFSASEAYGQPDGGGEIRLAYDRKQWRDTILVLIDNAEKRKNAAAATRSLVETMRREAEAGLDLSLKPPHD